MSSSIGRTIASTKACPVRSTLVALLALGAASAPAAERDDTALTVYSSAQPGAIPPELYRPVAGMDAPGGSAVDRTAGWQAGADRCCGGP